MAKVKAEHSPLENLFCRKRKNVAAAYKQTRLQCLFADLELGSSDEDTCKHGNPLQRAKEPLPHKIISALV
jgi:hypothetical protein